MRATETGGFLEGQAAAYKSPYKQAKENSEILKQQREAEKELKAKIYKQIDEEMPNATEEK
jgi:hypothetical protein